MSIRVDYERYKWNGSRKHHYRYFDSDSLEYIEDWLFGMMRVNYTEDVGSMGFSMVKEYEDFTSISDNAKSVASKKMYPRAMEFVPDEEGERLLIHEITKGYKIIFSDGVLTAGQHFWNKEVKDWMRKCYERQMHPKFNFAYDDEDSNANDKQMA